MTTFTCNFWNNLKFLNISPLKQCGVRLFVGSSLSIFQSKLRNGYYFICAKKVGLIETQMPVPGVKWL